MAGVGEAQIPAGRMSAPNGYPKDFAVVKREGLFHVFHIEAGAAGDFNYLGHQTSPDLYHWTVQPNVLIAERSDWNPDFVWAPSIIERDGTYWMFYTGVRQARGIVLPGRTHSADGSRHLDQSDGLDASSPSHGSTPLKSDGRSSLRTRAPIPASADSEIRLSCGIPTPTNG
jgi:sucrose-6-phosphate hydrolase SacC (GH32 family)